MPDNLIHHKMPNSLVSAPYRNLFIKSYCTFSTIRL